MADPHDLQRFVDAQAQTHAGALAELEAGRKTSHWMWFVFPQIAGLGSSDYSRRYAIRSLDEARAYLDHPLLGARLMAGTSAVLRHGTRTARAIFGQPDDVKFQACMTLFARASDNPLFAAALQTFFGGQPHARTLDILEGLPA